MTTLYPIILALSEEDQGLRGRDRVQAQSRRAREALALSCKASGIEMGPLKKGALDAPIPFNDGNTYWSLSHKSRYVAAVVGPTPVGIDLEEIVPRSQGLHEHIANEEEWVLADRSWETFFRYWTAKEAVLKAFGAGLAQLKKAHIHAILGKDYLLVDYDLHLWPVKHFRFPGHIVSLMNDHHEVAWKLL
jgi:4'-phosphopantetheinyl transferase